MADSGDIAHYPDPDSYKQTFKSLDRNHSHFLLVDDGTTDKFGGEVCVTLFFPQHFPFFIMFSFLPFLLFFFVSSISFPSGGYLSTFLYGVKLNYVERFPFFFFIFT